MSSVGCFNDLINQRNTTSMGMDQYDICRFIIDHVLRTYDLVPAFVNTTTGQTDGLRHGCFPYQHSNPNHQKYRFPVTLTHESDGPNGRFIASITRVVSTSTDTQKKIRSLAKSYLCYINTSSLPTLLDVDRDEDLSYKMPKLINKIINAWNSVWEVSKTSSSASTPASTGTPLSEDDMAELSDFLKSHTLYETDTTHKN